MKALSLAPWLLLLSACTLPLGRGGTPVASLPPTPTGIRVSLPPAWTPTPGQAPQSTAGPASQPTQAPTPTPQAGVSALRLSELPGGYAPAQPISYGLSPAVLGAGVMEPKAIAMFELPSNGTLVLSVAAPLETSAEEQGFGSWIEAPTLLLNALAGAMGRLEGTTRSLDGYSDFGAASAAAEGTILIRDARYSAQVVIVRQGSIGAYVAVFAPRGARLGFDLKGLVRVYAERLRAGGGGSPTTPTP